MDLEVLIVGSGPSAVFTAKELLSAARADGCSLNIHMIDEHEVPGGLVRWAVAPDHPTIRKFLDQIENPKRGLLANPSVHFYGGVRFGADVTRDVKSCVHAIFYCVGAHGYECPDFCSEHISGVLHASHLPCWYNGDPLREKVHIPLDHECAVVVGGGNVAADVTRILLTSPTLLEPTDIDRSALEALRKSQVRRVVVLVRRGAAQLKIRQKEMKELLSIDGTHVSVRGADVMTVKPDAADRQANDEIDSVLEALRQYQPPVQPCPKQLEFWFHARPVAFAGKEKVESIEVHHADGPSEMLSCGLVLAAIGYQVKPLANLPYDAQRHIFLNVDGRLVGNDFNGEYVAGWCQQGSVGLIGHNRDSAKLAVMSFFQDLEAGKIAAIRQSFSQYLSERGVVFRSGKDLVTTMPEPYSSSSSSSSPSSSRSS